MTSAATFDTAMAAPPMTSGKSGLGIVTSNRTAQPTAPTRSIHHRPTSKPARISVGITSVRIGRVPYTVQGAM
jgi:hypothetical protein